MSSEARFTTGPWRTQGWVPTWAYIPVKDARHNVVCSLYPNAGYYTREDVEANARLIAAAPEMYAAIDTAIEALLSDPPAGPQKSVLADDVVYHLSGQMVGHALEKLRAAKSKARGEPQ